MPFEAALEIGIEDAPLTRIIETADGLGERLGPVVDLGASYALAGREYVFSPGDTDTMLFVVIGRDLSLGFEDHHRHWLNRHGWLVSRAPTHRAPATGSSTPTRRRARSRPGGPASAATSSRGSRSRATRTRMGICAS